MGLKSIPEFDVAVVDDSFLSGDDASFADRRCCARCILASSRIRRAFPGEFNGPPYAPRANLFGDFIGDFARAFASSVATVSRTESGDTRLLTSSSSSSVSKDESSSRHAVDGIARSDPFRLAGDAPGTAVDRRREPPERRDASPSSSVVSVIVVFVVIRVGLVRAAEADVFLEELLPRASQRDGLEGVTRARRLVTASLLLRPTWTPAARVRPRRRCRT